MMIRKEFRPDAQTTLRLLRPLIVGTGLLGCASLLVWITGFVDNFFAPWDGLYLIVVSVLAELALARGGQPQKVAGGFIAAAIQPVFYYALLYGPTSPTLGLFAPLLVLTALLGGHGYLPYALGLVLLFIVASAVYNQLGWTNADSIAVDLAVRLTVFWAALALASGGLAWLFARTLYHSIQVATGQRASLTRSAGLLTRAGSLEHIQQNVLQSIADQLSARWGTLFLLEGDQLAAAGGIDNGRASTGAPSRMQPRQAGQVPIWQEMRTRREPLMITESASTPGLPDHNPNTALYLPLLAGDDLIGMLAINRLSRRRFTPDEVDLAAALAAQMALAIQLTRLAGQARESALLAERNRMAREIHDSLAQGFTGIVIQLEAAEDVLDMGDARAAAAHLERARQLARGSLAEARRSVWALRSQALADRSLPQAIQGVVLTLLDGTPTTGAVVCEGDVIALDEPTEHALLRVTQEAVTNALRHARPAQIRVAMRYASTGLGLTIRDDGAGFDPDAVRGGFGLQGMRERIEQTGGTLTLESAPGQGTTIHVEVGA
ncbi:MAG: GAF domain-containing sensor histidine kinase [Chloroflexi bacterium]|nr:GAF domain-containing sensor histidine kinase [Chloroflexota bacterium]